MLKYHNFATERDIGIHYDDDEISARGHFAS